MGQLFLMFLYGTALYKHLLKFLKTKKINWILMVSANKTKTKRFVCSKKKVRSKLTLRWQALTKPLGLFMAQNSSSVSL